VLARIDSACAAAGRVAAEVTLLPVSKNYEAQVIREAVVFEVAHRKSQTHLYWHLDSQYLGMTSGNHTMEVSPQAGLHKITVIDDEGNQIERTFEVLKGE
jgi:membrane carboxypeptidase/penicillin-binding protein PbpC